MQSADSGEVLSVAALGRPFRLGMLYDSRSEQLLSEITLWDQATLENKTVTPKESSDFVVLRSDSLEEKASALEVGGSLKLSFLSGLLSVEGAAKYLHNRKTSSQQERVTLQYKCTTRTENLTVAMLDKGKVQHPEVFDHGTATHVVTGITYGAQAFFIFDRHSKHSSSHSDKTEEGKLAAESSKQAEGFLESVVRKIPDTKFGGKGKVLLSENDEKEMEKFTCIFYGDFLLPQNPSSFKDAMELYQELPQLLGTNGEKAVPLKIDLYPLSRIDSKVNRLVRNISIGLIDEIEFFFDEMREFKIKCNDVLECDAAKRFSAIQRQMKDFLKWTKAYERVVQTELCQLFPRIRGGASEETCLWELLNRTSESPFSSDALRSWLQTKETELTILSKYTQALADIQFAAESYNLKSLVMDPDNSHCFCLTFSLPSHSSQLEAMRQYCCGTQATNSCEGTKSEVANIGEVKSTTSMREVLRLFRNFYNASKTKEGVSFVVAQEFSECSAPQARVACYKDGILISSDYELLSAPEELQVVTEDATHDSVTIRWSPPKYGASCITSYVVSCDRDAAQLIVGHEHTKATVPGLAANTEYEVRVWATCQVGNGPFGETVKAKTRPCSHPEMLSIQRKSTATVSLMWHAPACLAEGCSVQQYIVKQEASGGHWEEKAVTIPEELWCTVKVAANTTHSFRVAASCGSAGRSRDSEPATMDLTKAVIGKNLKRENLKREELKRHVRANSRVSKSNPHVYMPKLKPVSSSGHCKEKAVTIPEELRSTVKVAANTAHSIRVAASCGSAGRSRDSEPAPVNLTKAVDHKDLKREDLKREVLKRQVRANSRVSKSNPHIYMLNLKLVSSNPNEKIQKLEFGNPKLNSQEKVIMVVGATGSGKTTLINGLVNFIFGVERNDDFRFKMIEEPNAANQDKSQTEGITAYTLHHCEGFRVPYSVTIVDTPGFGDVRGIGRDKEITEAIRIFFTTPDASCITHIDAVGFVANSSQPRLTPTQNYVFGQILSIFGKDIVDNIFLLLTFGDGSDPQVLSAIEKAKIPYKKHFKFNNSALYAQQSEESESAGGGAKKNRDCTDFNSMFWRMGFQSYSSFMQQLHFVESRSLILTQEVLTERKRLETYVAGIRTEIKQGLSTLEKLQKEKNMLQKHYHDINENKDFEFEVEEEGFVRETVSSGNHTNCDKCKRTCHANCKANEWKYWCYAMSFWGNCTVCPGGCRSSGHSNSQYKYVLERKMMKKTAKEIRQRYEEAYKKKLTTENVIEKISEEFMAQRANVLGLTHSVRKSLERLQEIALRPSPLSTTQYIEILMEEEKRQAEPGWQARLEQLGNVMTEASYMEEIAAEGFDPLEQYTKELESKMSETNSPLWERVIKRLKNFFVSSNKGKDQGF